MFSKVLSAIAKGTRGIVPSSSPAASHGTTSTPSGNNAAAAASPRNDLTESALAGLVSLADAALAADYQPESQPRQSSPSVPSSTSPPKRKKRKYTKKSDYWQQGKKASTPGGGKSDAVTATPSSPSGTAPAKRTKKTPEAAAAAKAWQKKKAFGMTGQDRPAEDKKFAATTPASSSSKFTSAGGKKRKKSSSTSSDIPAPPANTKQAKKSSLSSKSARAKKAAAEDEAPTKAPRKYVKKSDYWNNRSGEQSPTAKSLAKKKQMDEKKQKAKDEKKQKAKGEKKKKAKGEKKKKPVKTKAGKKSATTAGAARKTKEEAAPVARKRQYVKRSSYWDERSKSEPEEVKSSGTKTKKGSSASKGNDSVAKSKSDSSSAASSAAAVAKNAKEDNMVESESESDSSVDLDNIVCCVCRCVVDFSDPDAFLPNPETAGENDDSESESESDSESSSVYHSAEERDQEEEMKVDAAGGEEVANASGKRSKADKDGGGDNKDEEEEDEEPFHPPFLPHALHDPNNALLLCDGKGCNRAYHQRCHFVPVLSVPRGEWLCLICRLKEEMTGVTSSDSKKGKGGKQKATKKADYDWDSSALSSAVSSIDGADDAASSDEAVRGAITLADLRSLYRVEPPQRQNPQKKTGNQSIDFAIPNASKKTDLSSMDAGRGQEQEEQLLEAFELASAPLKARLLHTELSTRAKSVIDQSLARIRRSENTIRAYTETSRARKSILDRYGQDESIAQELVQAVGRMASAKCRVRGMLRSLEYIVKTNKSWEVQWLLDYIEHQEKESQAIEEGEQNNTSKEGGQIIAADPVDLRALLFAKGLDKRRVEPRFESHGNGTLPHLTYRPTNESNNVSRPPVTAIVAGDTSSDPKFNDNGKDEDDALSIDHLTCVCCHRSTSSDTNDLLLCDGEGCFRAVHQNCIFPHVSEEELHEDVDWFCPLCSALGQLVHYTQANYYGDEWDEREREKAAKNKAGRSRDANDDAEAVDEMTIASWDRPSDVFPEAEEEERVAARFRRGGKRNERTDRFVCGLLGIPFGDEDEAAQQAGNAPDANGGDDYDEEEDSTVRSSEQESDEDEDSGDDESSAGGVAVEWKIAKSELNALSDYSSSDESSSEDDGNEDKKSSSRRSGVRVSKRLKNREREQQILPTGRAGKRQQQQMQRPMSALDRLLQQRRGSNPGTSGENTSDSEDEDINIGDFSTNNIIVGKRNRTRVDYRKLNDAMFGDVDDTAATKMFGTEEEYDWAKEISKKGKRRYSHSSSSSSSSSDDDDDDDGSSSSSDDDDDDSIAANDSKADGGKEEVEEKDEKSKTKSKSRTKKGPGNATGRWKNTKGTKKAAAKKKSSPDKTNVTKKRTYVKKSDYWGKKSEKEKSPPSATKSKKERSSSPPKKKKKTKEAKEGEGKKKRAYTKKSDYWAKNGKK